MNFCSQRRQRSVEQIHCIPDRHPQNLIHSSIHWERMWKVRQWGRTCQGSSLKNTFLTKEVIEYWKPKPRQEHRWLQVELRKRIREELSLKLLSTFSSLQPLFPIGSVPKSPLNSVGTDHFSPLESSLSDFLTSGKCSFGSPSLYLQVHYFLHICEIEEYYLHFTLL